MMSRWTSQRSHLAGVISTACVGCSLSPDILVGYNLGGYGYGKGGATASVDASAGGTLASSAGTGGNSAGTGATITGTGGTSPATSGSCSNGGPDIQLDPIGGCTTDLARNAFHFAICTCSDLVSTNRIATDAFDSRTTGSVENAGSIGINGSYKAEDVASQLGGSLWVMGETKFGNHDIAGDLNCAQSLSVTMDSRVHENAAVVGPLDAPTLTIDGTLTALSGTSPNVGSARAGTNYVNSLTIAMPCNCQAPIDIATIVDFFRTTNDNASQLLAPSTLSAAEGNVERTLACGRYYLDSLGGTGSITLHLTGKTVLAVGSDISNSGGLVFDLDTGAELDLFVNGNLELSGDVTLGDPNHPASTRIYITGQAAFSATVALYANLYIPNQPLVISAPSEVWGAIFAQSIQSSGGLTVHYDQSILDLPSCTASGQGCKTPEDCANPTPACRNGTCATCLGDGDCSPPLFCNQGLCRFQAIVL